MEIVFVFSRILTVGLRGDSPKPVRRKINVSLWYTAIQY